MYKTGDLGRWMSDGNIEFLGRIDNQVKIRGYRIELGEIESVILSYENISETVVTATPDKEGEKYLCGYIVSDIEINIGKIREYLLAKLPEYMVPQHFIQIEEIPLTLNGKVDIRELPEPDKNIDMGKEYGGPGMK